MIKKINEHCSTHTKENKRKQTNQTITSTTKTGPGQKEHGRVPGIYVLSQRIFSILTL